MWKELLSNRRPEHIETAFRAHVKSSPFFPTPADIVYRIDGMEPYFGTPLSNDQQNCKICGGSGWVEVAKKPGEKNSRVQRCECRMRKQP